MKKEITSLIRKPVEGISFSSKNGFGDKKICKITIIENRENVLLIR
jgi:hypothetical protein